MTRNVLLLVALSTCTGLSAQGPDYATAVAPVLTKHCAKCHGPQKQESRFRVDSREALLAGGDWGEPAVVPGKPDSSFLISVVSGSNSDLQMPPEGDRLTAREIAILREWIEAGAKMPEAGPGLVQNVDHWSFQPVRSPALPRGTSHAIDALVKRRLRESELDLSPPADRRTLIRRLYLVMHGLPPTPAQTQRFLSDQGENAWSDLVDRVLSSPRYGERWGQHWLDIIHFGETHGFETNRERADAWPFRDWVIRSFNDDRPWDDFVRQQIAGDVCGEPIGTGFLVAGPYDVVKGQDPGLALMQRQDELADMINTSSTAFLGLTVACARCHNHKFDPISQKDYYAVQAVFAGVQHASRAIPLRPQRQRELQATEKEIAGLRVDLADYLASSDRRFVLIDDAAKPGPRANFEPLVSPRGQGSHPVGTDRGFQDDPGTAGRAANIAGGRYTWFDNVLGRDIAAYRPGLNGRYRIRVSWGCGFATHSKDAAYVLDADGNPETPDDQRVMATVNQQVFADGTAAPNYAWSGLRDCGVHELNSRSAVLLRCGASGSAITADAILFERADDAAAKPVAVRPSVNGRRNVESFRPVRTNRVRFTILDTSSAEPCLDELEIFSGSTNVALVSQGAAARSSSNLPGYEIHKLEHIHDGRHGNDHSWISNESGGGWVEIQLPQSAVIDRIVWGRDRTGRYSDRLATRYRIEAWENGQARVVASSASRLASDAKPSAPVYNFETGSPRHRARGLALKQRLDTLLAKQEALTKTRSVYAGTFKQPGPTYRLYRGEPTAKREVVPPDAIAALGSLNLPEAANEQMRRKAFADWVASPDNPLTARVIANRLWQFHFGTGLVDTPSDFGRNGSTPTHPLLLDFLAADLIEHGWSLKHLHRTILSSSTWQQSAAPRPEAVRTDAGSRLWWRFPPRRLEAEAIRDSMLAVSGVLDLSMGGPGFSGFEVQLENVRHYFPKTQYGPDDWRRMIYMTKVRQERESVFGVFDCPDGSQVQPKRGRSTTPLQALNLLNSVFTTTQCELLAKRLQSHSADVSDQVVLAFELCCNRPPTVEEVRISRTFITDTGLDQFCRAMLNSNEFLFIP